MIAQVCYGSIMKLQSPKSIISTIIIQSPNKVRLSNAIALLSQNDLS